MTPHGLADSLASDPAPRAILGYNALATSYPFSLNYTTLRVSPRGNELIKAVLFHRGNTSIEELQHWPGLVKRNKKKREPSLRSSQDINNIIGEVNRKAKRILGNGLLLRGSPGAIVFPRDLFEEVPRELIGPHRWTEVDAQSLQRALGSTALASDPATWQAAFKEVTGDGAGSGGAFVQDLMHAKFALLAARNGVLGPCQRELNEIGESTHPEVVEIRQMAEAWRSYYSHPDSYDKVSATCVWLSDRSRPGTSVSFEAALLLSSALRTPDVDLTHSGGSEALIDDATMWACHAAWLALVAGNLGNLLAAIRAMAVSWTLRIKRGYRDKVFTLKRVKELCGSYVEPLLKTYQRVIDSIPESYLRRQHEWAIAAATVLYEVVRGEKELARDACKIMARIAMTPGHNEIDGPMMLAELAIEEFRLAIIDAGKFDEKSLERARTKAEASLEASAGGQNLLRSRILEKMYNNRRREIRND